MNNKFVLAILIAICVFCSLLFVKCSLIPQKPQEPQKVTHTEKSQEDTEQIKVSENEKTNINPTVTKKNKASAIKIDKLTASSPGESTAKPESKRVSFIACGDNIVHSTVLADAKELATGTGDEYDFKPMFANVADVIKDADIAFINQESPFGGKEHGYSGYPMFCSPDKVGLDLMTLGFDVINLANNHMLDSGTDGYMRTIEFWKKQPVTYIGGFTDRDDYNNIRVIEKDGISIAFLSYTYSTNGIPLRSGSNMVIPMCDDSATDEIDRQTKKARELADIVIVSMHWGNEDNFKPSELQKRQAQIMVNNGVDVIIGTHPHVLQPMEWQQRPDGGRTLIMYSIGNFLSGMLYTRNMVGGIAGFDLVKVGSKAFVDSPYFIPTVCQYNTAWRKFKIYRFSQYTSELLNAHRCQRISDPGHSLEYMRNIIDNAIPKEFLKDDFYKN